MEETNILHLSQVTQLERMELEGEPGPPCAPWGNDGGSSSHLPPCTPGGQGSFCPSLGPLSLAPVQDLTLTGAEGKGLLRVMRAKKN